MKLLFAYLDPGTGSILIQALIGVVAGVAVGVATYWARVRNWLRLRKHRDDTPTKSHDLRS